MNLAEAISKQNGDLFFSVEDNQVYVAESRDLYNFIRKKYDKLAYEFMETMSREYDQLESIQLLIESYDSIFKEHCMSIIKEIKKDLVSLECYDLDDDFLWEYFDENGYFEDFQVPYYEMIEKYESITGELQSKKDYRKARKDNRARWTTVTYGNQLDANLNRLEDGITNGLEGAAHSVFNAMGNYADKVKANSQMRAIYNDKNVKRQFVNGSYIAAFGLHIGLVELLCKKGINPIDLDDIPGNDETEKSRRLIKNIYDIDKEKRDSIIVEAIEIYPYDQEGYVYWLKTYNDPKGEIQALADYFGVEITSVKEDLALEYVKSIQGKTEEEAKEAREKLLIYFKEIGLEKAYSTKSLKYIDGVLKEFDKNYRTVDGYVCPTRSGADHSRKEVDLIKKFMDKIEPPTYDSLLDYEEDILEKKKEFTEKFTSEYAKYRLKTIDEYIKTFDDKFRTVGLKTYDRKEAGKKRLLKLTKKGSYSTPEEIKASVSYVEDMLPKVGLSKEEAKESFDYIEQKKDEAAYSFIKKNKDVMTEETAIQTKEKFINYCESIELTYSDNLLGAKYIDGVLDKFDSDNRTVEGFVCSSMEAKEESLRELDAIKEFMVNIYPPNDTSLIDYELSLKAKLQEFDDRFTSEIKEKYIEQIEGYLKDFDIKFCTIGFKRVDRITAGKERLLKYTKQFTMSNLEEINNATKLVEERLYLYGISKEEAEDSYHYIDSKKDDLALTIIMQNGNVSTEEYAKQTKEYLKDVCIQIGLEYDESLKSAKYINDIINKYDIMYRTVDGYLCTTREAADFSRSEYQNIATFMSQIIPPNNDSLLGYERYVLSKKEEFIKLFESELKNKYVSIMESYLQDFNKKFCSMGLFKTGTRKEAGIHRAIQFAKKKNLTNDNDYNIAYSEMMNMLGEFGITVEEARPAFEVYDIAKANQYKKSLFGGMFKNTLKK